MFHIEYYAESTGSIKRVARPKFFFKDVSMKLYVGNLANAVSEQELNDLFAQFGAVISVRIMKDKFTGQPRGFGFVEMGDATAGNAAINGLNNAELQGQRLRINEARPPQERTEGGFGGGRPRRPFGQGGNGDSGPRRGGFGGGRGGY